MIGGSNVFPPRFAAAFRAYLWIAPAYCLLAQLERNTAGERRFHEARVEQRRPHIQGGAQTRNSEDKVKIPSMETAFQISSIHGNVARNKNGEPEQVLILNTTADISSGDLANAIQIRLLPKREHETSEEGEAKSSDSETAEQSNKSVHSEEPRRRKQGIR